MSDEKLTPPSTNEVDAEAVRFRDNGEDISYAVYCTLLWVLGYGVAPPSELFLDAAARPAKPTGGE